MPLELVAIDILGQLPKTTGGYAYVLVITDCYSKLARAIPLRRVTAPIVADAFLTHWVYAYGIP